MPSFMPGCARELESFAAICRFVWQGSQRRESSLMLSSVFGAVFLGGSISACSVDFARGQAECVVAPRGKRNDIAESREDAAAHDQAFHQRSKWLGIRKSLFS